jgi:D-alanyl-D-alanine carboxypeptidase
MKKLLLLVAFVSTTVHAQYQGSWGLYDYELREYQTVFNRSEVRPIASITKLFTACLLYTSDAADDYS